MPISIGGSATTICALGSDGPIATHPQASPSSAMPDGELESLLGYVRSNKRVCPKPDIWNRFWQTLPNRRQLPSGGWEPAVPLILGGWWYSTDSDKRDRLEDHIRWAASQGVLGTASATLRGLAEADWHHQGD